MYQVVHHQFVASALVVKLGHEINPEMKIGAMCAMVPFYSFSSKPDDIMVAQIAMRDRYLFSDVMVRGHYPSYALRDWAIKGYQIDMHPEDAQILKEGKADYLGFSYYMSNTLDSTAHQSTAESMDGGHENSVPEPFIQSSDWGLAYRPNGFTLLFSLTL